MLVYDETTLLDVLGSTDVARDSPARALAYLDKIVQLRLDLPPVPQVLLDGLVDELLEHVLDGNCLTLGWPDTDRLGMAYQEHLRELYGAPHVKWFFAQVEALNRSLEKKSTLSTLFSLRSFEPFTRRCTGSSEPAQRSSPERTF